MFFRVHKIKLRSYVSHRGTRTGDDDDDDDDDYGEDKIGDLPDFNLFLGRHINRMQWLWQ